MSESKSNRVLSRRDFLRLAGVVGVGAGLAACTPQVVEVTQEVPVEVTKVVEKLVTPTPVAYKKGGSLNVGTNGDTKTLDPHVSDLIVWHNIRHQIFDQLLCTNAQGAVLPWLATGFTWVDNKTLELTLRTDVVFHNGENFTADDVKYTIDRILTPDLPSGFAPLLGGMDKVEVVAPDKVRFTLKAPDSTFTNLLAQIDIISKSVSADKIATNPVGTGAFKFSEWLPNESLKLVRNDKFRLADQPYLDGITYKPMPDSEARIAGLLSGDIDWDFDVAINDIARVATSKGIHVIKSEGGSLGLFYLNMRQPPFNDKRIRQALLYGFDRQGYNRNFQTGLARVTNSPIASSNWGYNPDVDKMYPYDTTKAKDLLKEAGFPDGKGLQIEVIYPVGLEEYKTISEYFQSMMNDIGVKVNVVGMELAAWSNKIIKEKTYQIAYDVRDVAVTEPADPYSDTSFTKPDPENFDGFTEETIPGYLDLINQGVAETDQAKRKDIYFKLQQMWADELPGWIISAAPQFWVTRDWVIDLDKSGLPPYRLNETWLNK